MKNNALSLRSVAVVAFFFIFPRTVLASSPTELVQATVVVVKNVLSAQQSGAGLTREQSRQISRVIQERFDFHEMARLALGEHWRQRSLEEREQFVELFGGLMTRSQLLGMATDADVPQQYIGERIEGNSAVVHAQVRNDDSDIPVDYFLLRRHGVWKVSDLRIDGVRLSEVYRAQFNQAIERGSYDEVVRQMRLKLDEVAFEEGMRLSSSDGSQVSR